MLWVVKYVPMNAQGKEVQTIRVPINGWVEIVPTIYMKSMKYDLTYNIFY